MVRCPRCGEVNPDDGAYCRKCGKALRGGETGFDRLRDDLNAQSLWLLRLVAYIIDTAIVGLAGLLLALLAYVPLILGSALSGQWSWSGIWQIPFFIGAGQVIYFTVMESMQGASLGKQLMGLRVEAVNGGRPSVGSALTRNLSKVHGALLFLDVLLGLMMGDNPRDRFSDTLAKTYVVRYGVPVITNVGGVHSFTWSRASGPAVARRWSGRGDPLDSAGFGVFLIVLAAIALNYPGIHIILADWVSSWSVNGLTWPPAELEPAVIWFLTAMGAWSLVSAVLRYNMGWSPWRAPQDIIGGVFNFLLAYLVRLYGFDFFTWSIIIPLFLVLVGAQILIGGLLRPHEGRHDQ